MKKHYIIFVLAFVFTFTIFEGSSFAQKDQWTQKDTLVYPFYSIEKSRFDSLVVYIGSSNSRLYKSTDGGNSFNQILLNELKGTLNILQLEFHPSDSLTLFALTDSSGLFKSNSSNVDLLERIPVDSGLTDSILNVFKFNPFHPDTIYVGTEHDGFFRSINKGENWESENSGFELGDTSITALAVSQFDGKIIYAGLKNGKIYQSKNSGNSWTYKGQPSTSQITNILIQPDDDDVIYVGTLDDGVYKSTNEGLTWSSWNTGLQENSINEILSMEMDITVRPVIYLAGTERNGVFWRKETDTTWTAINTGLTQGMINDLEIDPFNHTIYFAVTQSRGIFQYYANQEPVLILPYENVYLTVDSLFTMAVSAWDPDSGETNTLIFGALGLPANAVFDSLSGPIYDSLSSRIFSWQPDSNQTGNDTIIFYVRDLRGGSDRDTLYINVNTSPTIIVQDTFVVNEHSLLTINVSATDPDANDTLYFTASNLPYGALFTDSSGTGIFRWVPNYNQSGIHYVTFNVRDSKNATDSKKVKITVVDVNRAPYFIDLTESWTINEGNALKFEVNATDPDGDNVTYGVDSLPSGAKFDSVDTKIFSWIPTFNDSGNFGAIFRVEDTRGAITRDTISIRVLDVNRNPVLSLADTDYIVNVGDSLTFTVQGYDLDGDGITFNASGLPPYSSFNPSTGVFLWVPISSQAGSYQVRFNAEDGRGGADFQNVSILVNRVPVFQFVDNQTVKEGDNLNITVRAIDDDNDTLSYSVKNVPANAVVDTTDSITFQWTPQEGQAGYYVILCEVSDGKGGSDRMSIQIQVLPSDGNLAPQIVSIGDKTVRERETLIFQVVAIDDGSLDSLVYGTVGPLPQGAQFDSLETHVFQWTPTYEDSGKYTLIFKVTDPLGKYDEETVVITVLDSNRAPAVVIPEDTTVREGDTLVISLNAFDPDSDSFSLTGLNLPEGSRIDTTDGYSFYWEIDYQKEGDYQVIFELEDAREKKGYDTLTIIVENTNRRPNPVQIIYPKNGEEITPTDFLIWEKGTDPDADDTLTYEIQFDDNVDFSSVELTSGNINPARLTKQGDSAPKRLMKGSESSVESVSLLFEDIPGSDSLMDNVKYYWRVKVIDNRGDSSDYSTGENCFILNRVNNAPYPPVSGFSPADGNISVNLAPIISWYPADDPDSSDNYSTLRYILELDDNQFSYGYTYRYISERGVSSIQVQDTLIDDHKWYYRVKTVDDKGDSSDWSETQYFYTNSVNNPPSVFRLLIPADNTPFYLFGDSIVFKWEPSKDRDPLDRVTYTLEVSADSSFKSKFVFIRQEEIDNLRISIPKSIFNEDLIYYWRVQAVDRGKLSTPSLEKRKFGNVVTSISDGKIPVEFKLKQNYPNPFNSETVIEYSLPRPSKIRLEIYNLMGQRIITLVSGYQNTGNYRVRWNGTDSNGNAVASGIYIYTFTAKGFNKSRKLILIR